MRICDWSSDVCSSDLVAGLNTESSYFRVSYTDRVLAPIGNYRDSLNPAYADVVVANPTPDQIKAALDESTMFINNVGTPLDSSKVLYLINNQYRNVAAQKTKGIEVTIRSEERSEGKACVSKCR